MVKQIRLYFEGDPSLRQGFRSFFDRAGLGDARIKLIAGKATAVEDFKTALGSHPDAWNVLLIDSEGPDNGKLFSGLRGDHKLAKSLEGSVFWMVQVMESWFLADSEGLKRFYGPDFREKSLQGNPDVEKIPKADVLKRLDQATRRTRKGKYHKTSHAPQLLCSIDPERVRKAAHNCERIFKAIMGRRNHS